MTVPGWLRIATIAAILLGIFFRFYHLDRKTFWEDELFGTMHMMGHTEGEVVAHSADLVDGASLQAYFRLPGGATSTTDSLARTVGALADEDPQHPPLYYMLGRLWAALFGDSAAAIRSFSALASILIIPAAFWLCCELFERREVAWVAAALVAISPFHVLYAQEAREYAMWTVLVLVLCTVFLRACRESTTTAWAIYGTLLAIGLYLFPFTMLPAAGFAIYLVVNRATRTRRILIAYAVSSTIALALFAPWLRLIVSDLRRTGGVPRGMASLMRGHLSVGAIVVNFLRNVRGVFIDLGRFTLGGHSSTAINLVLTLVITALVAYALYDLRRRPDRRAFTFITCALVVPAVPLIAHDLIIGGKLVDQARYFIPTYLGAELAVAMLFARGIFAPAGPRLAWTAAFAVLLAGETLSCGISSQAKTWWNKDYEVSPDVAAVVNHSRNPLVVSDFTTSRALGLAYYLDPSVALRLRLHCDTCLNATPDPHADLLAQSARYGHIFVLGNVGDDGPGDRIASDPRFQVIDVAIYPNSPRPLGMFLSL